MPLRGPYKQYEVDTTVAVPKSTLYERRKRRFVEVDAVEDAVDNAEVNPVIDFEDEAGPTTDREDTDDSDFQVRFNVSSR